jgi:hypothetical protein
MTTMAICTIGANDLDKQRMVQYVRDYWVFVGEYAATDRLLHDAKTRKFAYILVYDKFAIDDIARELKKLNIEILVFKDKEKLQEKVEIERLRKQRQMEVKVKKEEDLASVEELVRKV